MRLRNITMICMPSLLLLACSREESTTSNEIVEVTEQRGIVGQNELPNYVEIVTDQHTGCQYLTMPGSITPRLDDAGVPICSNKSGTPFKNFGL
jgi:hypothetical protein